MAAETLVKEHYPDRIVGVMTSMPEVSWCCHQCRQMSRYSSSAHSAMASGQSTCNDVTGVNGTARVTSVFLTSHRIGRCTACHRYEAGRVFRVNS